MIYIASKRRKEENIRKEHPGAIILDVTSKAGWARQLSPFYPHGGIPIPNSGGATGVCVEGIWQGLKVFQSQGISRCHFANDTMKGLKRTVRSLGKPLGHQYGINSEELLPTNGRHPNLRSPLSHAALVKLYIEGKYPDITLEEFRETYAKGNEKSGMAAEREDGVLPLE